MIENYASRRTKTYAAAEVQDADGIKTSFASSAALKSFTASDLNGAVVQSGGVLDLPRTVTVTRTSASNQYSILPIVITGTYGGSVVTESLTPANDDGGDVLRGTQAFERITAISIPADASTGGSYTIGVQDICAPGGGQILGVELAAAGTLNIGFGGAANGSAVANTDAIPIATAQVGMPKAVVCRRVLTSTALSSPTTVGLTVYLM